MTVHKSLVPSLQVTAVLGLLAAAGQAAEHAGKTVELFNGKDLSGWTVIGTGCEAVVQDGELLIKAGNGIVQTERKCGDFVLEVDWKAREDREETDWRLRNCP